MINVLSFDPDLCKKSAIGVMEAQPVVLAVRHQHVPNAEKFSHAKKRETRHNLLLQNCNFKNKVTYRQQGLQDL